MRSTELTISNSPAGVAIVRDALDRLGEEFGIPPRTLVQLQVALDEIVSNVIKYSWPDSGEHKLLVRITAHPERLELEVFDDGIPFDPRNAPPPQPKIEGRPRPGGVGIHMIKQLVSRRRAAREHASAPA